MAIALLAVAATAIPLVTFDGAKGSTHTFVELNDPVMGGQSTGTWHVAADGFGVFSGEVVDVPALKAPGFVKAAADGTFSDVSSVLDGDLVLTVRSSTPTYSGFRVSFAAGTISPSYACGGGGSIPFSRGCYKAHFSVPAGDTFVDVHIPFSNFSDMWSPATGQQTKTCAAHKDVCPTSHALAQIKRIEVWAEGVDGKATLDVKAISAVAAPPSSSIVAPMAATASAALGAPSKPKRPPAPYDACRDAVQPKLKFGISGRTTPTVPVPLDPAESLAEAVCCDVRAKPYAEPRYLFEAPDVQLFANLPTSGPTTFYDSVCGVPVFRAPVGRTRAEFEADTKEHGWPSFRPGELVEENVVTNHTSGYITSSCGTHLGTYLTDAKGPRWCIDLSCVAGTAA